jgi:hypothetical protein
LRSLPLHPEEDDAPDVVAAISAAIDHFLGTTATATVVVVRIKNWFDSKWLGFSGVGRVPFDSPIADHPGVALAEFRQAHLTFPPFTPARVLSELHWSRTESGYEAKADPDLLHPEARQHSSRNLQKRVGDQGEDAVYFWYSSNSSSNGRASLMAYLVSGTVASACYVSMKRDPEGWTLAKVAGDLPGQVRTAVAAALHAGAT